MKIKFDSIKYKVDTKNKVVVCVGEWSMQNIYDYFPTPLGWFAYDRVRTHLKAFSSETIKFKGVARCSDEDEFNEITGKRIAESKMQIKAFDHITKALKILRKDVQKLYDITANHTIKLNYKYAKELKHLTKLIKDGNELLSKK